MLDFFTGMNQSHFENWRLNGAPGRVLCYLPTETECPNTSCGWDSFSQSGKLLGCPVCGGRGKVSTWDTHTLRARVVWGGADLRYFQPAPGVEIGDVYLTVVRGDDDLVNQVIANQRAYMIVDGKTVRPSNTSPSVIPNVGEGTLVTCNIYTDITADD